MAAGRIGFTTRASCVLAAGVTAVLCGVLLGVVDLVRAGCVGVAVPVVAAIVVRRSQLTVASRRDAQPARAAVGTPVQVELTMTNRSVLPTGSLMLQDQLPGVLDSHARFVLDGLAGRETRVVAYRLPALPRGRYRIGPLSVRLTDPFGMVDLTRSFASTSSIVVTPYVEALTAGDPGGSWELGELRGSRSIGARGADDASTREYRQGDDLRKIHWRSTARSGVLMVRQEERPTHARAAVLVDTRIAAHTLAPPGAAPGGPLDAGSLEWLIAAAASIGSHLIATDADLHVVLSEPVVRARAYATAGALVDDLADVTAARVRDLSAAVSALDAAPTVVALLGRLDDRSLDALTRLRRGGPSSSRLAVLVDTASWAAPRPASWSAPEPDAPDRMVLQRGAAALRETGWRVAVARRGDTVASVWGVLRGRGEQIGALR